MNPSAVEFGETQLIPDTRLDPDYLRFPDKSFLSELAVPVKIDGDVVGVINVESERLDAFTDQDRMLAETLAAHAAAATTRLRRVEERMEYQRKLRALYLNAQQLNMAKDLQAAYDVTLESMEHTLGLQRASVLMVEGDALRQVAQSSQLTPGLELPLNGKGVTVKAVKEGKSIMVPDVRLCGDYVYARGLPGLEEVDSEDSLSELVIPITADDKPVGVLNVESTDLDAFDEHDVWLLELLASHTGLAVSRLRHLEALKASEMRFRGIAERSFDLIFTVDPEGRLTYVSPASDRITGYPPEELAGKSFQELLPASEISRVTQAFAEALKGGVLETFPAEIRRRDGSPAFIEVNISPITGEGKPVGFQGIARDVTMRREDEAQIRELAYQLNGLEPRGCFICESHERLFKAYSDLTHHGVPGLCITREEPEKMVEMYGLTPERVRLLSSRPLKGFQVLEDLQTVSRAISEFLMEPGAGVVLLDGLEYLVSRFGFDAVYSFIQEKRFDFIADKSVLLVPLDPATLSERERALLGSELTTLK
ncbi:MAG: GAF domain-containing protein [Candidatus Bathyarchaeota archaeon]